MTDQIRPKVSDMIKQIAALDETGKSKSKIDTEKEYKSLFNYLEENKTELNTVEKSTITRLLDAAKKLLGIGKNEHQLGNEAVSNEVPDGYEVPDVEDSQPKDPNKPIEQKKVVNRDTGKTEIRNTYPDGRVEVYDLWGKHLRTEHIDS